MGARAVKWAVTGGAGYIGSHIVKALVEAGEEAVVIDDLSTGDAGRLPHNVPLFPCSVLDARGVENVLAGEGIDGVIHLAAKKSAPESVEEPLHYYRENVGGMTALLGAVHEAGVKHFVLSSSAAVYGACSGEASQEDDPTIPESPYGETKLICEWLLKDFARTHPELHWAILRYFNVVGAIDARLGDTSALNLVPRVFQAIEQDLPPVVFGDDYPTPDGTCVRDYIHVADVANAHIVASQKLREGASSGTFNIGTGTGYSVLEVMNQIRAVTGKDFKHEIVDRRIGDPASVVADVTRIQSEWAWKSAFSLREMVQSAWSSRNHAPKTP